MVDVKSVNVDNIINLLENPSKEDVDLISKAFSFTENAHKNQVRLSGDPYLVHPFEVAKILAQLKLGAVVISAGLLHDVCEDNENIKESDIQKHFGEEIAFLVSGVTKIGKLKYRGVERHAENLRKMFLAMARDIRVVLIRLADRLHNLKTLEHVPQDKRKRIAQETLEIYAPIANRLGMGKIRGDLEDLAFPFVYPEEYKKVKGLLKNIYEKKDRILAKVKYELNKELKDGGVENFSMDSRVKHMYSLFKKLQKPEYEMNIENIYDLIAIRVVVDTVEDCYKVLGLIHKKWTPLPGRIKDYIAVPKLNGYQSLHTSVFTGSGNITEIQIRTQKMHEEAEFGIAAHWAYGETGKPKAGSKVNPRLNWVNQLAQWQKDISQSGDFLEILRIDFFKNRVFCFTPKGDVIDLPEGATVIDFAYAVHTDIGNHAAGATVNHKYVALNTPLKNGDIVEIQVSKNQKPKLEWGDYAKTSLAKKHIKSSSKKSRR